MMPHGDLPPVGRKISLLQSSENLLEDILPYNKYWVDSGTSALALALLDAKAHFSDLPAPRAIIPGYCCPDLVAACVFAGIEPVVVDVAFNDPSYNLDELSTQLDHRVVAVIAINFLGIAERLEQLRDLIIHKGLATRLIEDNAQWFPSSTNEMHFFSDYVTFSFGRGKPLSLLGGGLLLSRGSLSCAASQHIASSQTSTALLKIKISAYNILLIPFFYMFLNRNPFLRLGETKYIPLQKIEALDAFRVSLLTSNFNSYSSCKTDLRQMYDDATDNLQQLLPLASLRAARLLRYPLLCKDGEIRDKLLAYMRDEGLGASAMYCVAIDKVDGVGGLVTIASSLENANSFACRFVTLPVNDSISKALRKKLCGLFAAHNH